MFSCCGASVDESVIAAPALASSSSHAPQTPQIRALVRALSAAVLANVIVTFALATAGCAGWIGGSPAARKRRATAAADATSDTQR